MQTRPSETSLPACTPPENSTEMLQHTSNTFVTLTVVAFASMNTSQSALQGDAKTFASSLLKSVSVVL